MNQKRRNFIHVNETFVCEHCKALNEPKNGEIRDHCYNCFYSKHVDEEVPGDRGSECKGLMVPIGLFYKGKKGYMIQFECTLCGVKKVNKVARDDNPELIVTLSTLGYECN
jgi:hypothetical protein